MQGKRIPEAVNPLPVLLGPRNCEAVTGLPWRHVREHARALGVPVVLVGRKAAVPAQAFLDAVSTFVGNAVAAAVEAEEARIGPPANDAAAQVREILRRGHRR